MSKKNSNLITDMPSVDDQIDPVPFIRTFNKSCGEVLARYSGNEECIRLREQDTQDILHEIELSGFKNAREGYKLYKKLKIVREDRRRAKAENEVLRPFVEWLNSNKQVRDQLGRVQGQCSSKQQLIANRKYVPRGDILEKEV